MAGVIVDIGVYREGRRQEVPPRLDAALECLREVSARDRAFCWVGLASPDGAELAEVADAFGLHPLAVEDAAKAHQRPKVERYDHMLFVVVKTLAYDDDTSSVSLGEVAVFVGADFVVTVRHGGAPLARTRADLERRAGVLGHGPAAVLYAVCDQIVDTYTEVANELEVDVDELETAVFAAGRRNETEAIYRLKRQLLVVRRAVQPLREPAVQLAGEEHPFIAADSRPFFRDVADHVVRVGDHVESLDDLLTSALNAHLAQVGVQQNEDMRKISAGVAMFAVPTTVASVFGMNFDHIPGMHWLLGFPTAVVLMLLSSLLLYVGFRRAGWL